MKDQINLKSGLELSGHSAAAGREGDAAPEVAWPLASLHKPPAVFQAPGFQADGVPALFYEGVPWKGQPTRVFAWMQVPKVAPGQTCPGVVLLHGGGGTAFHGWVQLWNSLGYAAIAMDLCGSAPGYAQGLGGDNRRHEHGGPPGHDASFDQTADPVGDQWPYHAVAAAIAGHSLLAAQHGVDPGRIGVSGISWGGCLASVLAGVDSRLRAVVPVYGCGFLGHDSTWNDNTFPSLPAGNVRRWLDLWDPARYLARSRMPMCWVSGTNDFAYPLSSLKLSYENAPGPRTLCIRVEMAHGHVEGWSPAEIGVFMDSILRDGDPLPCMRGQGRDGRKVWAVFESKRPIARAELCTTRALGHWTDRKWSVTPARIDTATGRIEADLPARTAAWFLNVFDDRNCIASTPHSELDAV
ncbi:MAG: acetylxylan esterase [bacterium]